MYETWYDRFRPCFRHEKIDNDSFVLGVYTNDITKDLKKETDFIEFINLNEGHEIFSNKTKRIVGKVKIETHNIFWIE